MHFEKINSSFIFMVCFFLVLPGFIKGGVVSQHNKLF